MIFLLEVLDTLLSEKIEIVDNLIYPLGKAYSTLARIEMSDMIKANTQESDLTPEYLQSIQNFLLRILQDPSKNEVFDLAKSCFVLDEKVGINTLIDLCEKIARQTENKSLPLVHLFAVIKRGNEETDADSHESDLVISHPYAFVLRVLGYVSHEANQIAISDKILEEFLMSPDDPFFLNSKSGKIAFFSTYKGLDANFFGTLRCYQQFYDSDSFPNYCKCRSCDPYRYRVENVRNFLIQVLMTYDLHEIHSLVEQIFADHLNTEMTLRELIALAEDSDVVDLTDNRSLVFAEYLRTLSDNADAEQLKQDNKEEVYVGNLYAFIVRITGHIYQDTIMIDLSNRIVQNDMFRDYSNPKKFPLYVVRNCCYGCDNCRAGKSDECEESEDEAFPFRFENLDQFDQFFYDGLGGLNRCFADIYEPFENFCTCPECTVVYDPAADDEEFEEDGEFEQFEQIPDRSPGSGAA